MSYIIVETHGGAEYATIVTDPDGENMSFDDKKEAEAYASEECQKGVVVPVED